MAWVVGVKLKVYISSVLLLNHFSDVEMIFIKDSLIFAATGWKNTSNITTQFLAFSRHQRFFNGSDHRAV